MGLYTNFLDTTFLLILSMYVRLVVAVFGSVNDKFNPIFLPNTSSLRDVVEYALPFAHFWSLKV